MTYRGPHTTPEGWWGAYCKTESDFADAFLRGDFQQAAGLFNVAQWQLSHLVDLPKGA